MQVPNTRNKKIYKKDWIKGIIFVIAWMLIFSLAKDLWQVKKGFVRIDEVRARLIKEEEKNNMLKAKLEVVTSDEYKEKIIREQLNMQKIGEVVAVLPKNWESEMEGEDGEEETVKNWERWWKIIK